MREGKRERYVYVYTYLLFPELGLENVGGVADGPHFLKPSLHSRQPDLHLVPFRLVSLAVPEHRVQLRLPLHHFRVHLVPVLPQLRNWNNNRADVLKRSPLYPLYISIFFFLSVSHCVCGKKQAQRDTVEENAKLIWKEGDNVSYSCIAINVKKWTVFAMWKEKMDAY